jgi:hypothetical protein
MAEPRWYRVGQFVYDRRTNLCVAFVPGLDPASYGDPYLKLIPSAPELGEIVSAILPYVGWNRNPVPLDTFVNSANGATLGQAVLEVAQTLGWR